MNYLDKLKQFSWLLFFQLSYYFIYCYTKIELLCKPKFNLLTSYIKTKKKNCTYCEYVKDGVVTTHHPIEKCDFVLYSDSTNNIITNKIIQTIEQITEPTTYEISNEKFIMVEITIEDKTIPLKFSNEYVNYYIVGNSFDNKFMFFFLTQHYSEFYKNKELLINKYKLKIIDSNVEIKELDETCSIIITKDGYNISRHI